MPDPITNFASVHNMEAVRGKNVSVGVSMNIVGFKYDMIYPFLEAVPFNPVRNEKELPDAVNDDDRFVSEEFVRFSTFGACAGSDGQK